MSNMEKFGYVISKGRQIDYDSNDRRIADYIIENEASFKIAFHAVVVLLPALLLILPGLVLEN
jgi:hypothetical protein